MPRTLWSWPKAASRSACWGQERGSPGAAGDPRPAHSPTQPPLHRSILSGALPLILGTFTQKMGVGTIHCSTPDSLLWVAKLWGPHGWTGGVTVAPSDHSTAWPRCRVTTVPNDHGTE